MTKRILFICGSMNQTTQMHQISVHLPQYEQAFSPYYCDGITELCRKLGLMEFTIIGYKLATRCRRYLQEHGLAIDDRGEHGPYDLVLTCSDVYLQKNIRGHPIILVQEGITDPESFAYHLVRRFRRLPRWLAGTAATGLSGAYRAFCVASDGYRDFFIRKGVHSGKIAVTGIPNFDDCHRYRSNTFPHRGYVLVCTSPLREVFRGEDRSAFLRRATEIADGRPLIFKLHPNENAPRAIREISHHAPGALVFTTGSAEEMIANCDVLITRFSSTAFVGLALGKETHSDFNMDEMRRLMPIQNRSAAPNIARVCSDVLQATSPLNGDCVVRPVVSRRDRRRFQRLPWTIYASNRAPEEPRRDPNWVPPILAQERELLGWGHHPFFESAEMITLLAERDERTLGRLAVLVNHVHNHTHKEQRGFFGFFECVDDVAVARGLFEAGEAWLRERGMKTVRGPVNPSQNYTCGLLVDGFDRPPCFLMTYNPPYYAALLEACGYAKSQDLYAYEMDRQLLAAMVAKYKPAVVAALDRSDLVVRSLDASRMHQEIETYLDMYNRSLEGTWGFSPLQPREASHIARDLRHIIVPQLAAFAEVNGRPIGALLALLDYNQILRKCNGRMFPFGFVRLALGRRNITMLRAMSMTMVPGYQAAGLGVVLLDKMAWTRGGASDTGIERYEFSWVLESNARSRGTLQRVGTKITATYRLYDKDL